MPNRPWSDNEVKDLESQYTLKRKIRIQGRSDKSIRRKLISLGLSSPKYKVSKHKKKRWSDKEIELLRKGEKRIPGRTKQAIRGMLIRLGMVNPNTPRRPWKRKEVRVLKSLIKSGKTAKEVFEMNVLPYSKNSIQKKICSMGLSKKKVLIKKLSFVEKSMLKSFLLESWRGKTPDDLLEDWNSKPYFKVNRSKILYYLSDLKIKIPYYEVAKINNQRKKEQTIKHKVHRTQKELAEAIRLSRVDFMRQRLTQGKDIWTGVLDKDAFLEVE